MTYSQPSISGKASVAEIRTDHQGVPDEKPTSSRGLTVYTPGIVRGFNNNLRGNKTSGRRAVLQLRPPLI